MSLHRLGFKIRAGFEGKLEEFIPVFHGWIQRKAVDGLLVDVADYSHLPQSPGVVLVGFEADRSMDATEGPLGLLYLRKRPGASLKDAWRATLDSCAKLEDEPALKGRLRFSPAESLFIANDRLEAPNDGATWAKLEPELKALLPGASITRDSADPRRRLTGRIQGLTGDVRSALASL
ncbi:MAG TPA: hypothetical protein VF950_20480 [Planctomycetota bacterium]